MAAVKEKLAVPYRQEPCLSRHRTWTDDCYIHRQVDTAQQGLETSARSYRVVHGIEQRPGHRPELVCVCRPLQRGHCLCCIAYCKHDVRAVRRRHPWRGAFALLFAESLEGCSSVAGYGEHPERY